jgi:hypothetical protein
VNADRFRGLARSSPWRWRSLEFTLDWWLPERPFERVHAWLERPDGLRVESADGRVLLSGRPGRSVTPPPVLDAPQLDGDGLVIRRTWAQAAYDPMYQNYYWVALLDPAELADGTDVAAVAEVHHHGRPAIEATVRPEAGYDARCTCCALLPCELADVYEGLAPRPDGFSYPDRFVARVDVETGVCVYLEAIGGTRAGVQHDMTILAAAR